MSRLLRVLLAGMAVGLVGISSAQAQSSYDLFGSARISALGYASTALGGAAGVNANPAVAASHSRRLVSFYAREGFRLSSLRYGALYTAWPFEWGVLSGGASTFGEDAYRESHYSLGFARSFRLGTSRQIHVGILGRYYHTRIKRYGSAGTFGVHLGLLLSLLPSLQLGAHATNVNSPQLVDGEALPQTLSVGLQYRVSSELLAVVDVFKDIAFPVSVRGGLEVRPVSVLALRAGIATAPIRFTGGAGIRLGWIRAHVAAEQHQELGWSPSASLEVSW